MTLQVSNNICTDTVGHYLGMDSAGKVLKREGFTVQIIDRSKVGVEEAEEYNPEVYPNPFDDVIKVRLEHAWKKEDMCTSPTSRGPI